MAFWTSNLSEVGKSLRSYTYYEMYSTKIRPRLLSADRRFRKSLINLDNSAIVEQKSMFEEDSVERVSLHCLSMKYIKLLSDTKTY